MTKASIAAARALCGLALWLCAASAFGQSSAPAENAIPPAATGLQGAPTVRVDTTPSETTRHALTGQEANKQGLSIAVDGGRYFWSSRANEELTLRKSGEFIYLTTTTPGRYIRLKRINDRFAYVEHLEMESGSVTYFGELRIVLGK